MRAYVRILPFLDEGLLARTPVAREIHRALEQGEAAFEHSCQRLRQHSDEITQVQGGTVFFFAFCLLFPVVTFVRRIKDVYAASFFAAQY